MKPILSLLIGTTKLGTIVDTGKCFVVTDTTATCDKCKLSLVDDKVVDEKLRLLSSDEYIIITDRFVFHKNKVYRSYSDNIPAVCQYKAMFIIKEDDIIDLEICKYDTPFINQGYAKEIKQADHVFLIKGELPDGYSPGDLLVKKKEGLLVSCTGRKYSPSVVGTSTDKYVILKELPPVTGNPEDVSFTYTLDSLCERTLYLNYQLQEYGRKQVESARIAMIALAERISQIDDYYKASSIYEDIHGILKKIRSMQ